MMLLGLEGNTIFRFTRDCWVGKIKTFGHE